MADFKRTPLLPSEDAREAALFFVVAALCFLASLTGLATRAAYGAAESWVGQVQGELVVRMDEATEEDAANFAELLLGIRGISAAEPEAREDTEKYLEPWLGKDLPKDLPVARYIIVQTDHKLKGIPGKIASYGKDYSYEVSVENAEDWAGDVERSLSLLRLIGFVALGLLATIVVSVIAFATHAALLARRDVVNVLHTCGASDRFISRLFEYRFFGLGLKAGGMGALFALFGALLLFFLARQSGDRSWLLPRMSPDIGTFVVLFVTPVVSALVSMIAARITVSRALSELT